MIVIAAILLVLHLGLGIIIGHFAIPKKGSTLRYAQLTREPDQKNYRTFLDSIQGSNIEANLK